MKRVVAITLVLVIVTSLFSFSVFAESPVQPLQVVTYSDTSTQLRISGTAERLHYNVDSFQVVFTNPPNNYGTACTPVLVSFRFYNSSDLPAYVGQAEFEIVCTNGTGSTNLIIYGYDQISTDLFIAESTYSTSEVGRIGIGASNDFAYYTGFVVPPKTSLYFSAIVYVNASAYEGVSNVTGSQEQVNQLTMSSLNLYTNQISFSADYPYYGEPIDFTDIIEAIGDLQDTVSTSSEMQQLIDVLTYAGTGYTPQSSVYSSSVVNVQGYSGLRFTSRRDIFPCYYVTEDIELDNADDYIVEAGSLCYPVCVTTYWRNSNTLYDYTCRYFLSSGNVWPSSASVQFVSHESNYVDFWYDGGRTIDFFIRNGDSQYGYLLSDRTGYSTTWFNVYVPVGTTPDFGTYSFAYGTISSINADDSKAVNIFDLLQKLYKSLVKSDSDDNTEEAQDMNDEIHEAELVWYDNNSEALEQVGLSNYRFSPSQSNGITQAVTQFQAVWNALGNWTNVYIFILILSISTYIIRHEPTTRVKQYRSSVQAERAERISYYGKKNAEARASSSGSTLKNAIRRRK